MRQFLKPTKRSATVSTFFVPKSGPKEKLSTPGIVLVNPKYAHNVGAVLRAASCFGVKSVVYTGNRVSDEIEQRQRTPREERMRGYKDVSLVNYDKPLELFSPDIVPVAIELKQGAEPIQLFEHPEECVYFFGPEDGSIGSNIYTLCHRIIYIPSAHCLNLAGAVYVTMYDRVTYRNHHFGDPLPELRSEEPEEAELFDFKDRQNR